MATPIFVDVSSFNRTIDYGAYAAWVKQFDGVSRIAIKASEGTGFQDALFTTHRDGSLSAGIDRILYYHYGRPDLNSALAEAEWMHSVVGSIRKSDTIMLDYELSVSQSNAEWAFEWLSRMEQLYPGQVIVYSYDNFILTRLQDSRLAKWPLYLASYTYDPAARPACPPPWKTYEFLQYSDKATIPGISGPVDADIFLGSDQMINIPTGWKDDGTTLTAPNGEKVVLGFRDHILNSQWDAGNVPLDMEYHTNTVLLHNPGIGAGQEQLFRDGILWYTTTKGVVWEPYLGLEIAAMIEQWKQVRAQKDAQITDLQQQLATAQKQSQAQPYIDKLNQIEALAKI